MNYNTNLNELVESLKKHLENRRFATVRFLTNDIETVITDFNEVKLKDHELVIKFLGGKICALVYSWCGINDDEYELYSSGYGLVASITFSNKGVGM